MGVVFLGLTHAICRSLLFAGQSKLNFRVRLFWLSLFAGGSILMLLSLMNFNIIFRTGLMFIIISPRVNSRESLAFICSVEEISDFSRERALAA